VIPRRLATWKILGIVAAVLAVVLLATLLWIRSVTADRWARLEAELKVQAAAERARDAHRPVLRGTAVPGNAWDDYRLVVAELQKLPGKGKLSELVQRAPNADPSAGVAALAQGGRALDLLARGASKESSRLGFDWEKGTSAGLPGLGDMNAAVSLAVLKARALADEGRGRDAAAVLLDAAQFGRDVADDGPLIMGMIGMAMLMQAMDGIRELMPTANAETLADLERGLSVLDGGTPTYAACLRREHLAMAWTLILGNADLPGSGGGGWGFGLQLVCLNSYSQNREFLERSASASERGWSESLSVTKAINDEVQKSWNPMTKMIFPGLGSTEKVFRERLAQLRLLRVAVQWRRTAEVPGLDDPFGGKLHAAPTADGLKLWSVGPDGVDHGGKGEWKATPGPDIVLETKR